MYSKWPKYNEYAIVWVATNISEGSLMKISGLEGKAGEGFSFTDAHTNTPWSGKCSRISDPENGITIVQGKVTDGEKKFIGCRVTIINDTTNGKDSIIIQSNQRGGEHEFMQAM